MSLGLGAAYDAIQAQDYDKAFDLLERIVIEFRKTLPSIEGNTDLAAIYYLALLTQEHKNNLNEAANLYQEILTRSSKLTDHILQSDDPRVGAEGLFQDLGFMLVQTRLRLAGLKMATPLTVAPLYESALRLVEKLQGPQSESAATIRQLMKRARF